MTDNASTVYQPLISARARRLRVTGVALLTAVLAMTLYGSLVLMPSLRALPHLAPDAGRSAQRDTDAAHLERTGVVNRADGPGRAVTRADAPRGGQTARSDAPPQGSPRMLTERQRKAALAKVLFVYGYWSVCGLLILALVIVSWLDFRELGRSYDAQRARLLAQSLAEANDR